MKTPEYSDASDARWKNSRGDFEGYDQDVINRNSPVWQFFDLDEGNPLEPNDKSQDAGNKVRESSKPKYGGPPIFDPDIETLGSQSDEEPRTDGGYVEERVDLDYEQSLNIGRQTYSLYPFLLIIPFL